MDIASPFVFYAIYRNTTGALINAWEIFEMTNAVDMFVPTMTMTALLFGRSS